MKTPGVVLCASISLALLSFGNPLNVNLAAAQDASSQPDNSAQNKGQSPSADNQSHAKADRELAAQARKAIIADKDLSTYAHNVKVIVINGNVTLKGPVRSDDERQKVVSDVGSVVSSDRVANQLTVKQ